MTLIPITKFVEAEYSFVASKRKYDEKFEHYRYSYSFANNLCVVQKCTEEGIVITNAWEAGTEFIPCKLENDMIMFVDPRVGWIRDEVATEKYAHMLADKELLK